MAEIMAGKETQNDENKAAENQENKQQQNEPKRMVVFECRILNGDMVRGVPNIVTQDDSIVAMNPEWETGKTEIQMDSQFPEYMKNVGKAYCEDKELAGVMLIKHIGIEQYWLVPVGVPDFILMCVETAKKMQLHTVE